MARLDPVDRRDWRDNKVDRDLQALLEPLVVLGSSVELEQQGREDLMVYKVDEASLVTRVLLASLDLVAFVEIQATPDLLEQLVLKGVEVLRDCLELLARVILDQEDRQDQLETLESLDLLAVVELRVFEVPTVTLESLASQARPDHVALPDREATSASQDCPDSPE